MKKYEITYIEGNVINKKVMIEAENKTQAILEFLLANPNAIYETITEVEDD